MVNAILSAVTASAVHEDYGFPCPLQWGRELNPRLSRLSCVHNSYQLNYTTMSNKARRLACSPNAVCLLGSRAPIPCPRRDRCGGYGASPPIHVADQGFGHVFSRTLNRSGRRSRTFTDRILNPMPLPLGYSAMWRGGLCRPFQPGAYSKSRTGYKSATRLLHPIHRM